jgi:hypothetical protein
LPGVEPEGGPIWQVWLALEDLPDREETENPSSSRAPDMTANCAGALVAALLLIAALGLSLRALRAGEVTILLWLLAGHLPILLFVLWLIWDTRRRVTGQSGPPQREGCGPPTDTPVAASMYLLSHRGLEDDGKLAYPWEAFSSFTYLGEDGSAFRLRLRRNPKWWAAHRQQLERGLVWRRVGLNFAAAVSAAAFIQGLLWFGWRLDVGAALAASAFHLVLLGLRYLPAARREREVATALPELETSDLLFDSGQVFAEEAVARVSQYIPSRP